MYLYYNNVIRLLWFQLVPIVLHKTSKNNVVQT